jgi:hypothetical protein
MKLDNFAHTYDIDMKFCICTWDGVTIYCMYPQGAPYMSHVYLLNIYDFCSNFSQITMIFIILTTSPLPPQVFLLYMKECNAHMSRIFWITETIHPCYFNPEMLNEVFPDIVRGMTKLLASGHTGKDRTHLRK